MLDGIRLAVVSAEPGARRRNVLLLAGLMLWMTYTRVFWQARSVHATLPSCPFLMLTGHPCPFCGGTRSFAYMWQGDSARAAALYPLGPLLFWLTVAAIPVIVLTMLDDREHGYAQNLTDGIVRARYRGFARGEAPSLIEPERPYEYEIDLWSTSNLFRSGHRIRLDVTSSSFPRWDRNPNTGDELGADAEMAVARQTILHDRDHPSRLLLCVVPFDELSRGHAG